MSDDVKHPEDDQTDQSSTSGDDVKHGGEDNSTDQMEKSNPSEPTPAQKAVEAQKQGLLKKIKAGDLSLDDVRQNKDLKWLAPDLEKELGETPKDIEALARKLAKEEAQKMFDEQKESAEYAELESHYSDLSKAEQKAIDADFKAYESKLGRVEAMKLAMRMNGIKPDSTLSARRSMSMPTEVASIPRGENIESKILKQNQLSDKELREIAKERRRGLR